MPERPKSHKTNKTVFTIITDRLPQDSSEQILPQPYLPQNDLNLFNFQFPLDYELQEIHQSPQATQLSAYILYLQNQLRSITNKIQYEYHQTRETVLFMGQSTNMSKQPTRKKIDEEFSKMGIIRKYQPNLKGYYDNEMDQQSVSKQAGDIAIDEIKRKIQIEWQSQISDQMQKQRRRMRQAQKKKQKQLQQIDKDFEKLMKKRRSQKQLQIQIKSLQSMKSLANNNNNSFNNNSIKEQQQGNRIGKKIQKREKMQRKSQKELMVVGNSRKRSSKGSCERNSIRQSQIESCSVLGLDNNNNNNNNNNINNNNDNNDDVESRNNEREDEGEKNLIGGGQEE